jgi:hypothetical protein
MITFRRLRNVTFIADINTSKKRLKAHHSVDQLTNLFDLQVQ